MKQVVSSWLSVYFFYASNQNFFLNKYLIPLINELEHQGYIRQYFFIRYSEGGPHIRLRLMLSCMSLNSEVRMCLEEKFYHYVNEYPSERTNSINYKYPDNSLSYEPYIPEYIRYGGYELIDLAEKNFYYSSKLTLDLISDHELTPDNLLPLSIHKNLCMCISSGLNIDQTLKVLLCFWKSWFSYAAGLFKDKETSEAQVLEIFESRYNQVKDSLLNSVENIIHYYSKETKPETSFDHYSIKIKSLSQEYNFRKISKTKISEIILSLIHMNNNRLGVANFDESFIGYITFRAISELNFYEGKS